jgi:hypothetical protein
MSVLGADVRKNSSSRTITKRTLDLTYEFILFV